MTEDLKERVRRRLEDVIDPETGVDVVRMRLIEELTVDEQGCVSYKFRPSSPFCPMAIPLALSIRRAVADVEGVTDQEIEVVGYINAEEVSAILSEDAES
ncbi:MAG: iron-sulfur cluster assembly protein [Anaerolineae bacterium]